MPEAFDRYRRDGSPASLDRVVAEHWPLVLAVCRRYLARPEDAEDAAQDVFLKLVRHADAITGNVSAWLSATARTTCVDLLRRRRRRPTHLGGDAATGLALPPRESAAAHRSRVMCRLPEAIAEMDQESAAWLVDRYVLHKPLRVSAGERGTSVPTASRRCRAALAELTTVLEDFGVLRPDDHELTGWLARIDPSSAGCPGSDGQPLTEGAWREQADPLGRYRPAPGTPWPQGWSRPIRVGVLISWLNWRSPSFLGLYCGPHGTLASLRHVDASGYELFAVVDPGSSSRGLIERSIREYDVTAGLMTWDQADALDRLDVLVAGQTFHICGPALRRLHAAVRRGVGFYNEASLTGTDPADATLAAELRLGRPPLLHYCTPGAHGRPRPARVHRTHPIVDGLSVGEAFAVPGCGYVYRPADGVDVVVAREDPVVATYPPSAHAAPMKMPTLLAGRVGAGRVVQVNTVHGAPFHTMPRLGGRFVTNCLRWLAEPRRDAAA